MLEPSAEARLLLLESNHRRMTRAIVLLTVLAALPWLYGLVSATPVAKELETKALIVRDQQGRITATLDERGLHLLSPSGKLRVILSGGAEWAALGLLDEKEKLRAHLTVGEDGHASLLVKDETERN